LAIDLATTGQAMVNPFVNIWDYFVQILPGLIAGIILLIVGYFIASILGYILHQILEKVGLDKSMEKARLSDAIGHMELSALAGSILKWYIFIVFLGQAAAMANLGTLSDLLVKLALWLPNLIFALIIFVFGLILAEYASTHLVKTKVRHVRGTGVLVKIVIIFFISIIALREVGLDISIAENTFLILIAGIILGLSAAFGIGFGMAFKDEAKAIIKKCKKKRW